jgi:hypothetical protein
MAETEGTANFGISLKHLVGCLIFLTLKDGTRLKGDLKKIKDGVIELHSLKNIHYIEISDIKHIAIAKEQKT